MRYQSCAIVVERVEGWELKAPNTGGAKQSQLPEKGIAPSRCGRGYDTGNTKDSSWSGGDGRRVPIGLRKMAGEGDDENKRDEDLSGAGGVGGGGDAPKTAEKSSALAITGGIFCPNFGAHEQQEFPSVEELVLHFKRHHASYPARNWQVDGHEDSELGGINELAFFERGSAPSRGGRGYDAGNTKDNLGSGGGGAQQVPAGMRKLAGGGDGGRENGYGNGREGGGDRAGVSHGNGEDDGEGDGEKAIHDERDEGALRQEMLREIDFDLLETQEEIGASLARGDAGLKQSKMLVDQARTGACFGWDEASPGHQDLLLGSLSKDMARCALSPVERGSAPSRESGRYDHGDTKDSLWSGGGTRSIPAGLQRSASGKDDDENDGLIEHNGRRDGEETAAMSHAPKQESLKFKDCLGRKWNFPLKCCGSWDGMKDLISQAFEYVEPCGPAVAEGRYDLTGPGDARIEPEGWHRAIKECWEVKMRLCPMREFVSPLPGVLRMVGRQSSLRETCVRRMSVVGLSPCLNGFGMLSASGGERRRKRKRMRGGIKMELD